MKTQITLLTLLLFGPIFSFGQFSENFSNDTINTDVWFGDLENFTVTAQELQLIDLAPVVSFSNILAEVSTGDSTNWEFYYRQEFSASGTNFGRVYLSSNSDDLSGDLNGYFVQLGGISGNADRIELYRQSGSETELLISGKDSTLANEPSLGRIRVQRNNEGLWTLWADYSGGTNFVEEGTAMDNTHPFGTYFGFACKYSSTRADKFFFDDISIDPLFVDSRPPEAIEVQVVDGQHINLLFDEPLNKSSAETPANYQLSPSVTIGGVLQNPMNESAVQLTLSSPLISMQEYQLSILGVEDKKGNAQNNQVLSFTFYKVEDAEPFDLLITEIYPDPNPPIGLPETEYLEIYNRSEKIFDLQDFILADNSEEILLPSKLMFPGEYLVLYEEGSGDFSAFGDSLPLPDFITLGNSFDDLVLSNPAGEILHAVFYQKSWYQNGDKAEGGFSLELINPRSPCTFRDNWIVSENPVGGTPGLQNSVFENSPNENDLDLVRVFPLFGGTRVELIFNKSLDIAAASNLSNYSIDGVAIIGAAAQPVLNNQVILDLGDVLAPKTIYTLTVKTGLTDCVGSAAEEEFVIEFGLPEAFEAKDVIINEVLFNPYVGGVDFVELYNRSDKIIDISNLFVANRDDSLKIDQVQRVSSNYLLLPDQYVVLTSNPFDIMDRYVVENPKAFLAMSLPTYTDKEGSVIIYFIAGNEAVFVDEFSYQESYHNPLLDNEDGVSLERIFADGETQDPDNWHSAAEAVGFATPTYRNSQDGAALTESSELISIPYTTFSPDSDGFRDFLSIQYETPEIGFLANVRIFDAKGRHVRDLSQNELLGTRGILQWDGTTKEGTKARVGIYLLWIELFHPDGRVENFKENCVLAGQLN